MNEKHIYFVEYVNSHLDTESKKGIFSHFIYKAVVINESDLVKAKELRTFISNKFWQGSLLESSKIDISKRLQIVETFKGVAFAVFSLIINKRKIKNEQSPLKRPWALKILLIFH